MTTPPTLVALNMSYSNDAGGEKSSQDVKRSSGLLKVVVIGVVESNPRKKCSDSVESSLMDSPNSFQKV